MNKFEWLSRLVSFDTTSRNSNLELINFVRDWLAERGVESKLIFDAVEPKANLFATIPAHDGNIKDGLILSGHTDVVPIDGQNWDTNPFTAVKKEDRIFGRGTCDMKGFIAVVLSLVPDFLKMKLSRPIYLAFSYDEEIGCRGAPFMINEILQMNISPHACIVGEPTNMQPVVAHKGKQSFRCTVHGTAAHSSLTNQGCNAIEYGARLICFIRDLADEYRKNGPFDKHFDVPFTTLTTNLISGGNALNTIPALCEFVFEFRHLPDYDASIIRKKIDHYINEELLPKMRNESVEANLILDQLGGAPGLNISEEERIVQFVRKLTECQDIVKVAYGTEAGLFQKALIPTVICGPGSIEQAHRANEFVAVDQLEKCERFVRAIVSN